MIELSDIIIYTVAVATYTSIESFVYGWKKGLKSIPVSMIFCAIVVGVWKVLS